MPRPLTRTRTLRFRATPEEDEKIRELAKAEGLNFSDYVRGRALAAARRAPVKRPPARKTDLEARVRQLVAQGVATPAARQIARKEAGK